MGRAEANIRPSCWFVAQRSPYNAAARAPAVPVPSLASAPDQRLDSNQQVGVQLKSTFKKSSGEKPRAAGLPSRETSAFFRSLAVHLVCARLLECPAGERQGRHPVGRGLSARGLPATSPDILLKRSPCEGYMTQVPRIAMDAGGIRRHSH
jgi:hypothetical protein